MTLTIIPATRRHVPALHSMIGQLCAIHGDQSKMGLAEVQSRLIDTPHLLTWVALIADTPIGYVIVEPQWRPMDSGDGWDICHLFVQAPHRNTGIGQALIAEVQKAAKAAGASRLTIGTAPNNPGAAAAYRAMGHHEITGPSGPRFRIDIPA